mgnify:CR=1 FL=1
MKQDLAGFVFKGNLAEVYRIRPPAAASLFGLLRWLEETLWSNSYPGDIAESIALTRHHQPAIRKIFGALVIQSHAQLSGLLFKLRT